jgi:Uncharacterized protein conserved in bacteria
LLKKKIKIGCHITLVGERWISDENIFFTDWVQLSLNLLQDHKRLLSKIKKEIETQITVLRTSCQILSHIDSHQHIHMLPSLFKLFKESQLTHNIPRIRVPYCLDYRLVKPSLPGFVLQHLSQKQNGLPNTLPCCGLKYSGNYTAEKFINELSLIGNVPCELIVHPGYDTASLKNSYANWNYNWKNEINALLSDKFHDFLRNH